MREFGFIIAERLGYNISWVEEDPYANGWTAVGFPKDLIKIGLVAALGFVEGRVSFW